MSLLHSIPFRQYVNTYCYFGTKIVTRMLLYVTLCVHVCLVPYSSQQDVTCKNIYS